MNTVIIVNLNGNAFHIEEPGYVSLRAYLDGAGAQLKDNPDKSEIMSDLEQAIADKCAHHLQPHKNVLTIAEIDSVLTDVAPEDAGFAIFRYPNGMTAEIHNSSVTLAGENTTEIYGDRGVIIQNHGD